MFSRTKMVRLMLSVAFAAMLAPVVGQWFVKLFEQWGAYDNPARQVGPATSWVSALIASPAYQRGLTLVAGAAVAPGWIGLPVASTGSGNAQSKTRRKLSFMSPHDS